MNINIIGDGSAGKRHARILGAKGHACTILGPEKASPVQHPECEAVVIASPPETHKLYLSYFWDKCPILCEGPVTWIKYYTTKLKINWYTGDPYEVKTEPEVRSNFVQMTAENWVWVPQVQDIKTKIQTSWGMPQVVHANFWFDYDLARWRPDIDYRTTCYYTSGIDLINLHSVMLPFYFFGPAQAVHVVKQQTGKSLGVDSLGMVIHHKSGTISTVNSSWHAANFQFGFKMVMVDGSTEEAWWTSPKDDVIANTSYETMCQAWLDAIEKNDTQVSPSLLDGYRAYKALQGEVV